MLTANATGFREAQAQLERLHDGVTHLAPLYTRLAGTLEAETEANLDDQGRPRWQSLAPATIARRLKSNRGSSVLKMLQDHGILAASVSSSSGEDFVEIGAGGAASAYAPIQQLGGTINRAPYSTKVRLRTDAKGNLLRQSKSSNLPVFAKNTHKRARETWHLVPGFSITIPARPYLPFFGSPESPKLQPEAETSVLATISRYLDDIA